MEDPTWVRTTMERQESRREALDREGAVCTHAASQAGEAAQAADCVLPRSTARMEHPGPGMHVHGELHGTCMAHGANLHGAATEPPAFLPSPEDAPRGVEPHHLERARKLVADYSDIAPADARCPDGLPPFRGVEMEAMQQLPGCVPARTRLRRYTPAELEACREYITDLLRKGWISPAQTEYGSPVLFVEKPTGGLRCVIDGRARNTCTRAIQGVLPDCQELLDRLQGKTIFSTLDLIQGYNQIRLLPSDVPFTGMTTPLGTYVWNVLPMGTRNASFVYQATYPGTHDQGREGALLPG